MKSLPKFNGDNIGGVHKFWFIPARQVDSIPEPNGQVIDQDIVLKSGAAFYEGYSTLETLRFEEDHEKSEHGNFYEQVLGGFYPKESPGVTQQFEEMAADRFIVIFQDNNNYYKLLGSLENPLRFEADMDTTDTPGGRNGYTFEFRREADKRAPFYEGLFQTEESTIDADQAVSSSLIFVLDASSDDTVEQNYEGVSGEYDASKATLTNVQSFTIYVNNTSKSGKLLVGSNDTLKLEVTRQDLTQDAIINIPHT